MRTLVSAHSAGARPTRRRGRIMRGKQGLWLGLVATVAAFAVAACGGSKSNSGSSSSSNAAKSGDDGATLTMWTRAATQTQSERFVKAYNASHKNQIKL